MNLEAAKKAAKSGKRVQPDYFGPGWTMVYLKKPEGFYDQNPITGTMLEHRFDDRDEKAKWKTVTHETA